MAWDDRDYNRDSRRPGWSSGGFGRGLWWLLTGSVGMGSFLGIRIRIHTTFILLLGFQLLRFTDVMWTLRWSGLLFVSVLLHEFGHCLACRRVGGTADEILMWPLGGLAMCRPPHRPWAEFVTVVWGPLVTLILAAASYFTLMVWMGPESPVSLNPFQMWSSGWWGGGVAGWVRDIYLVNYTLLLFNLALVFYPFDGGRLIQTALWAKFGYLRSMKWATAIGMAGAGAVAMFGLLKGQFFIALIGGFGFYTCYRQSQALAEGAYPDEPAYDVGYYNARDGAGGGLSASQQKKIEKRRAKERATEAEVDRILAKVAAEGLASLSKKEKKTLNQASEAKRGA